MGIVGQETEDKIKSSIVNQSFNAPPLKIDELGSFELPKDCAEWSSGAFSIRS